MIEHIVLGIIQGIVEWLPISSEGVIILAREVFFSGGDLLSSVEIALFLHLGTFFAALVYFWSDIKKIFHSILNWTTSNRKDKSLLLFLVIATLISGLLGIVLLSLLSKIESSLVFAGNLIMAIVGILLLVTGFLEIFAKKSNEVVRTSPGMGDSVLLGLVQGFAALPGLSRSGLTVSTLLLRKYSKTDSLRLSFLLSLPIVLGGNIALNLSGFSFDLDKLLGLLFSFAFGLLTIHVLMKAAKRFNFGWFVVLFGLLSIIAAFI